jgi:hypothetical protein
MVPRQKLQAKHYHNPRARKCPADDARCGATVNSRANKMSSFLSTQFRAENRFALSLELL